MRNADSEGVYRSFVSAAGFFYENGPRLVALSVVWVVCSLPLVTVGPATLGAYAAIASLRDGHSFDRHRVVAALRRHGLSAMLLTGVPLVLAVISALYVLAYLTSPTPLLLGLAVGTAYAAVYAALVLVPTFAGLANGDDLEPSIRAGFRWTISNAVGAVTMAMATLVVFVVSGLLTVAFALAFAGFTFAFHLDVLIEPTDETVDDGADSLYASADGSGGAD